MKKILIIGGTSTIAQAAARIWAEDGNELFLVARSRERLNLVSTDLKVRGASKVHNYCIDMNNFELHAPMIGEVLGILGRIDIVLIAHGTLSNQLECELSVEVMIHEIKTNALSTIAFMTRIANHFESQGTGTIAVISSVAGDRGRASNYVYGSAKAMVTNFTSGLRQRLYRSGVSVLTIKPGFVDTPMTAGFKKNFMWSQPETIGKSIVHACGGFGGEFYVPKFWGVIMFFIKNIPNRIFVLLNF